MSTFQQTEDFEAFYDKRQRTGLRSAVAFPGKYMKCVRKEATRKKKIKKNQKIKKIKEKQYRIELKVQE